MIATGHAFDKLLSSASRYWTLALLETVSQDTSEAAVSSSIWMGKKFLTLMTPPLMPISSGKTNSHRPARPVLFFQDDCISYELEPLYIIRGSRFAV